ncbi:MAG: glycosyltransferase family 4 protein [Dehalococcoidia bacterium]
MALVAFAAGTEGAWRVTDDARGGAPAGRHGVVVANPGGIPELVELAAGLARQGALRTYLTQIGSAEPALPHAANRVLPARLRRRLLGELHRRRLPDVLGPGLVRRRATALEILTVACRRARPLRRAYGPVLRLGNAAFDRQVADGLMPDLGAFIGAYTASPRSLRRCRELGIPAYLDYPIAHHRFAEATLREEARRIPMFAPTLQAHTFPPWLAQQLDREIAVADVVFMLSSFQKRTFVECGVPAEKLIVVPPGVDLDRFSPAPRPEDGVFRVLFCGQITQRKGISYLLDAFAGLAKPGAELVMLGQVIGTDQPWRGRQGVRHVQHVPRSELPGFYASADVLVLPSLVEGFGLTALEAMACGRSVIVSENTFGHDVVREGVDGFVVPVRDAEAIAKRLAGLRDDPGRRRRMGSAARARAETFSWARYGERIIEALRDTGGLPRAAAIAPVRAVATTNPAAPVGRGI